jgi:heme/copper-type cytochrome/quinol oxidase subunit 3
MALLISSEATLFLVLIASYFFLRYQAAEWPLPGSPDPKLGPPLVANAILVASSLAVLLRLPAGFVLAIVLQAAFVALQLDAYDTRLKDFVPQQSSYESLFYALTGIHLAHVVVGIALLAWGLAVRREAALIALYVHFVNAIAIAIFLTVYVAPLA